MKQRWIWVFALGFIGLAFILVVMLAGLGLVWALKGLSPFRRQPYLDADRYGAAFGDDRPLGPTPVIRPDMGVLP